MSSSEPQYDQLAFSGVEGLVSSKERRPFRPSGGGGNNSKTTLNVEIFGSDTRASTSTSTSPSGASDDSSWPYLLFIHGVCESAETWTVQNLAKAARDNKWRLAVLELEGHGLSTGKRSVCGSFSRLVEHVNDFVRQMVSDSDAKIPFALCGASLGGVLAAYGADYIITSGSEILKKNFIGVIPIVPAVGVAPEAVPPAPIVGALRILAAVAPSTGFLTPVEDSSHYACPETSTRNFNGSWPLSTSKMLLDVTSGAVESDQNSGRLVLEVPSLLVIAGERDDIIPLNAVKAFYDKARASDKAFVCVPKGDHGLMVEKKTSKYAAEKIFEWLNARLPE